jgi:hypothetical protein
MKKSVFSLMALCLVFVFVLAGCPDPNTNKDLPVKRILWVPDTAGFIQFYTNDPADYNYIIRANYGIETANLTAIEIECKKMSGNENPWYGLWIDVSVGEASQYYCVGIDVQRYFIVEKYDSTKPAGERWSTIKEYERSDKLNSGYEVTNKIKVTKSGTSFTVFFNNSSVHTFTITETVKQFGIFAEVGGTTGSWAESFPNTPFDVRFKRTL